MPIQNTRYEKIQKTITNNLGGFLSGTWTKRSISAISLLLGFFLVGSNLAAYYLSEVGQRPIVVLCLLIIIEILIRIRTTLNNSSLKTLLLIIDNLRIGAVYAVVLEAFKLGS